MTTARKLFRLFKSINEYAVVRDTFLNGTLNRNFMKVSARIAYLLYWILDNMTVLIKIKFLKGYNLSKISRLAAMFRLIGLILNMLLIIKTYIEGTLNDITTEANYIISCKKLNMVKNICDLLLTA